ncbi:uncharacterized protein [Ptychodera flava]|uniref:uncharacterized protein n=1 Tax=Ptychodera flava TaxID=63121 RepID=UPI00396A0F98
MSDVYERFKRPMIKTETMGEDSDVLISLWDFAGQSVYYITHQDNNIRSIDEEANKRLQEIVEYLRKHAPKAVNAHIVGTIAIDNRSTKGLFWKTPADPAVDSLQQMIQQLVMKYFFCGEVQARWILLELSLRKQPKQKMTLDEVKALGRRLKMEEAEIMEALAFYHDIGEILHFKAIPELNETIIVDVAWLVNLFKILITRDVSHIEKLSYTQKIRSLLEELHREGRLHEELVDHLLEVHQRGEDKVILLLIMEMYDILCEIPGKPREKRIYYLPSLLQNDADGERGIIFPAGHLLCCQLYYHFKGNFLPEGLFYRFVIRCLRYWSAQGGEVVLRKRAARIFIKRHQFHLTICKEGSDIQLQILSPSHGKPSIQPQPKDVRDVRIVVENELQFLINTYFPGSNYQASVKCRSSSHPVGELLPGAEDINDRCLPISLKEMTVSCKLCALPLEYPDLDFWYFTEGERESSTGTSDEASGRAGLDPLSDFFNTLQGELTDDDTRHMINLLQPTQISRRDAQELNTPFDVFNDLRQKGYVSENDLELLKNVFRRMRKATLVFRIDEYLRDDGH